MDRMDNIGENEIRVIGRNEQPQTKPGKKNWLMPAVLVAVAAVVAAILWLAKEAQTGSQVENSVEVVYNNATDSTVENPAYVEITDTIINNVSLHRFIPINARPKLEVGVIKDIPPQYILGAMAADFGLINDKYQVIGAFVYHGQMLSHSKSKYGFCALLKDTLAIGNDLSTSFFEQSVEEGGDFFRQYALVHQGEVVSNPPTHNDALRRSLCRLNDGRVCVIDTDMSVSLDSFSMALHLYGVRDAVALMGSGAAVRWAVDQAGRRFIAGADEYDFPDVVNYIVWEKTDKKDE